MIRNLIKTGLANMLHKTGIDNATRRRFMTRRQPLILTYHRVVDDFEVAATTAMPSLLTSVDTLERQLDWLGNRFDFVTLDDALAWMRGEKWLARPAAVVTFDDGYADIYQHAYPLLLRKNVPFAVFIVTDLVGTDELQIHDAFYLALASGFSGVRDSENRLAPLLQQAGVSQAVVTRARRVLHDPVSVARVLLTTLPQAKLAEIIHLLQGMTGAPRAIPPGMRAMNRQMLTELSAAGVTIGSHTRSHAFLTRENTGKVVDEVRTSRQHAERILGIPVRHFAYPNGDFNIAVVNAVAEAGYRFAYTICSHRDRNHPWLTIPRRVLWERSGHDVFRRFSDAVFACETNGIFDSVSRLRCAHD